MRLGLEAGDDTLTLAEEQGIRGVPIAAERLVADGVDAALEPLRRRGLAVCQIGAFGYNPLSTDTETQEHETAVLTQAIALASAVGCRYIVIGPGNYHPSGFGDVDPRNYTDEALDAMAAALRPMAALAEQHDVLLSFEPYLKAAVHGPESYLALHERVGSDALRANVDPTSLYTYWDVLDPRESLERTCAGFAGHYGLVHIKEVGLEEGFHVRMGLTPLANGRSDWVKLLQYAGQHLPDDAWVVLEHVLSVEEGRESIRIVREAAKAAGVTLE